MTATDFLRIAEDLELAGLVWLPEIGDEILERKDKKHVSVLFDPQGMTPDELRYSFLWLPTVEQMVMQFEARSSVLEHTGFELSESAMTYRTVIKSPYGGIEVAAGNFRSSVGLALRNLLISASPKVVN